MQLATKHAIAQSLLAHDALYKRTVLLDQLKDGLKQIGAYRLLSTFAEKLAPLFVYQGTLTPEEVKNALYVEGTDDAPVNHTIFEFLLRYIESLSEKGMLQKFIIKQLL